MRVAPKLVCSAVLLVWPWSARAQQAPQLTAEQHLARASAALHRNRPDEAIPELKAAVELQPNNADAQANLGVLQYFAGDPAQAVPHFRAALAQQPALPKIRGLLGLSELQTGDRAGALEDLSKAVPQLEEAPFRKQTGLALVQLDKDSGRGIEAATVAHLLREKSPTDPDILYACYRVDTDLAGEALLSLSLGAPASGQMYQAIAHELLRRRDVEGAIANLRHAESIDPKLPGVHFELAEAMRQSASAPEKAEAEAEYRKALQVSPRDVSAAVQLANLLTEKNSRDEAEKLDKMALSADSSNNGALTGLAQIYSETGRDAQALPLLQQVVRNDPTDVLGHFRLAALYRKLHRPEDAKQELATYSKLRALKQKLENTYSAMKLQAPGASAEAIGEEAAH